jgi:hypothetical protein
MDGFIRIYGFSRYEINRFGVIRNTLTNREISVNVNDYGYIRASLYDDDGRRRTPTVHRLIGNAFIPNPNNLETINHKDGNKLNNSIDNLEWMSRSDNLIHAYRTGIKPHPTRKLSVDQVHNVRQLWSTGKHSKKELSGKLNIGVTLIHQIIKRKIWKTI